MTMNMTTMMLTKPPCDLFHMPPWPRTRAAAQRRRRLAVLRQGGPGDASTATAAGAADFLSFDYDDDSDSDDDTLDDAEDEDGDADEDDDEERGDFQNDWDEDDEPEEDAEEDGEEDGEGEGPKDGRKYEWWRDSIRTAVDAVPPAWMARRGWACVPRSRSCGRSQGGLLWAGLSFHHTGAA